MGSDRRVEPAAHEDEQPQHRVYLETYWIARVPVTNSQYKRFVDATGHGMPSHWKDGRIPQGQEQHPVVFVSWLDAQAFCRWAGVRLPAEAEWEKAARGTDRRIYPWGNNKPTDKLCNLSSTDTTPVNSYPAGKSPYGCLDMAGNVWEWTSSIYKTYRFDARDGRENADAEELRVLRGNAKGFRVLHGRATAYPLHVRCAHRNAWYPGGRSKASGFRVTAPGL